MDFFNLEFARAGQKSLLLDLYLPQEGQMPWPVIVWIHGGAWRKGSKDTPPALFMVARGYAVASISYRLSQEAIFPAQIFDCKAAVRWLWANAGSYDLNPVRIGAWGASAGGHLAALLGTSGGVERLEGTVGVQGYSSRVQAVCDWFGPSDFLRMNDSPGQIDHDAPDSPESQLIGGPIQEHRAKVAQANPITYIGPDTPPFLIMHGRQDDVVPPNQSLLLHQALQAADVQSTLVMLEGQGHGFTPEARQRETVRLPIVRFFDEHLKP